MTPTGYKRIEEFAPGDLVLSRDESDVFAPIGPQVVEEVFVREGRILEVVVRGRTIATTPEHPFWVLGHGWLPAGELQPGDVLADAAGGWVAVEAVRDAGGSATVYNLRVSDWHTYFVGDEEWGFGVWSHNSYADENQILAGLIDAGLNHKHAKSNLSTTARIDSQHGAMSILIDLTSNGGRNLDNPMTLVKKMREMEQELRHGQRGALIQLRIAAEMVRHGDRIAIETATNPLAGHADIVNHTAHEAYQIKAIASADPDKVASHLAYSIEQLAVLHQETPPTGIPPIGYP